MGNNSPEEVKLRDDVFTEAWRRNGGVITAVAKDLGISLRNVQVRRRDVENRTGVTLSTTSTRTPAKTEFEQDITGRYGGYQLTIRTGRVLVGSDLHATDYTPTAMRGMVACAKTLLPAAIIVNGDDIDAPSAGKYPRNGWMKQTNIADDLRFAQRDLALLEAARPAGAKLIRTLGNHDMRFETYLANHAAMFEGVPGMTLADHFPLWTNCVAVYVNGTQAVIKHRWHNGIHAVYNNVLKGGTTIVTGHTHSQKVTPYTNFTGTNYGVDCGMLADPFGEQFNYGEHNPCNHRSGFALLTFIDGQLMPPELAEVVGEGRIWFRGKVWEV